jgi:DNA mismatch repair protein MutL
MPRVALLDPHTINQIAAGEVVERPASVAKELLENAVDAGATRIEIAIEDAGRGLIRVRDNGCGMSREDAETSLLRHATSKIRAAGDLHRVHSLGFRGEALPSIASVSRLTITTGEGDGARSRIVVDFGRVESIDTVAGPAGTEVSVERLFENTPARLKFLRSDSRETSAVAETVSRYALAFPNVAFRLTVGESETLTTTGSGDLHDVLCQIWGTDLGRALAEVDSTTSGIRVQGFVAPPHVNKPTRSHQVLFVNGRPVRSKTLYAALDAAYRSLTPDRRYAVGALSLSIDPADVDVNVSPTKSEVKFQRDGAVFDAIRLALKSGLMEHGLMPSAFPSFSPTGYTTPPPAGVSSALATLLAPSEVDNLFSAAPEPVQTSRFPFGDLLEDLRVLGQALDTFIIATTRRGIVIIDQHVAHERVLYEYLCGLKKNEAIMAQALLNPSTIQFERGAANIVSERLSDLASAGFVLEPFGSGDFLIRAVPAILAERDFARALREIVDEMEEFGDRAAPSDARHKVWITSACRMAVKAGDPLRIHEIEKLIADLADTENPYLCPHGRPITVTLTYEELLRRFKRT